MKKENIIKLVVSIIICEAAGIIGSFFTSPSISTWYASLQKSFFTVPNWVFAPVWTTLFLLMGISLYFIWIHKKKTNLAVTVFGIQLGLNVLWSILFFGLRDPFLAFIEIIMLWIAILATIIVFYRISKRAGLLLVPYIAWVSFATILNYSIWILN